MSSAEALDKLEAPRVQELLEIWMLGTPNDRRAHVMCEPPAFLRRSWMIGQMRLEKIRGAGRSDAALTDSLQSLTAGTSVKFVFEEDETEEWTRILTDDMSKEDRQLANEAWAKNNAQYLEQLKSEDTDEAYGLLCIYDYLTKKMKLTTSALHDATLQLGLLLSADATLLQHFASLHQLIGENSRSYGPQTKTLLSKHVIKSVLKCLGRGGAKIGGVGGNKPILLERLQNVLRVVKEEGKRTKHADKLGEEEDGDPEFDHDMEEAR